VTAGIVEKGKMAIAGYWHGKHFSMVTNTSTITEEPLEAVFPMQFMLRLCNQE
jgi:hypothetical protein